jgi:hypothetical protein
MEPTMSDDDQDIKQIKTSALDQEVVEDINRRLFMIEKIKSTKIRRSSDEPKKEDIEDLPLPAVDSMIGFATQGDSYHNDLELLRDRILGEAEAPQFVSPRLQAEEEEELSEERSPEPEGQLLMERTPSPLDGTLDEDDGAKLAELFGEPSGAVELIAAGEASSEPIAAPQLEPLSERAPEPEPEPEPEILGGFSLSNLEELQRAAPDPRAAQAELISAESTLANEEELIIIDEEGDDEGEEWELEALEGLMDISSRPAQDEALAAESTVADSDKNED